MMKLIGILGMLAAMTLNAQQAVVSNRSETVIATTSGSSQEAVSRLQMETGTGAIPSLQQAEAQVRSWRQMLDADTWTPDLEREANAKGNLPLGGFACGTLGAKSKRIVLKFPPSGGLHTVQQYRGDASKFCPPEGIGKISFTDGSTWYGEVGNRLGLWARVLPYPDGLGELSGDGHDRILMIARPNEGKTWGWHVELELFNYTAHEKRAKQLAEELVQRAEAERQRVAAEQARERNLKAQASQPKVTAPGKRISTLCPDGHDCDVID